MAEASTSTSTTTPKPTKTTDPPPPSTDEIVSAAEEAKDAAQDEANKMMAEQVAAGFAPPYDPADPRSREEKEQTNKEILGLVPTPAAPTGGTAFTPKTSAQTAAELERLRSGVGKAGEMKDVTIDGVHYRVPLGVEVTVPDTVKEVLQQSEKPIQTSQMLGGTDGTGTITIQPKE